MRATLALTMCLLGAALMPLSSAAPRPRRAAERWLELISEIARAGAAQSRDSPQSAAAPLTGLHLPPPIKLEGPHGTTMLQLVLVPVPNASTAPARCELSASLNANAGDSDGRSQLAAPSGNVRPLTTSGPSDFERTRITAYPNAADAVVRLSGELDDRRNTDTYEDVAAPLTPGPSPAPALTSSTARSSNADPDRRVRYAPNFPPVEDSALLLQQFLAQAPDASLPPVVLEQLSTLDDDAPLDVPDPAPDVPESAPANVPTLPTAAKCGRVCKRRARSVDTPSPPLPSFERSLMLQAVLTVPRAGYSEPYTLWWDAASGAARMDYHGGAASTYRAPISGGRLQSVLLRMDHTGAVDVRRCVVTPPRRVSLAERAMPALPDLSGFSFAGYVGATRVERWRRELRGVAVRGEVLTRRHELLVARSTDNRTVTPLRYAVVVDSSLLGDNCDGYVHRFEKVVVRNHDPAMFQLYVGDACEQVETTDELHLVEPLREFTMLQRDPRYDGVFESFKTVYSRTYKDNLEESIRKVTLINSNRFTSSGNREGATFEQEVNFLGDRLAVERSQLLLGATESNEEPGETFPHSAEELKALRGRLPQAFSWVERGGVTSVRNQIPCNSCWAFAVTGAVEGALFAKTGRLVPLSEQSLVDCGAPYGTHGCNATWPNFAYNYVKHQGLPALDEYTPYQGKELRCRESEIPAVTRISGHVNVTRLSVTALKVALRRHGPTVVLVDGAPESFALYKGGNYADAKCRKNRSTHAMLAVGWKVVRGQTQFRLKNSWSAAWGDGGYMWLHGGSNTCGVLRAPSYPLLRRADVLRVPAAAQAAAL